LANYAFYTPFGVVSLPGELCLICGGTGRGSDTSGDSGGNKDNIVFADAGGESDQPLVEPDNPGGSEAQSRAVEIRDIMVKISGWWFRREATVGVAYMQNSEGVVQRFVAVNEGALEKWGSDVQNILEPGEQWIEGNPSGKIHPEVLLTNYATNTGQKIIGLGASTSFCDVCKLFLQQEVGQEFLGQDP